MNWFIVGLQKYATFTGRAQRAEYWYFTLFWALIYIALLIIDGVTGTFSAKMGAGLLSGLFSLATFLPCLAIAARRLHDIGKSGWWLLLAVIPIIGGIVLIIFLVKDSDPNTNAYGQNPKNLSTY